MLATRIPVPNFGGDSLAQPQTTQTRAEKKQKSKNKTPTLQTQIQKLIFIPIINTNPDAWIQHKNTTNNG